MAANRQPTLNGVSLFACLCINPADKFFPKNVRLMREFSVFRRGNMHLCLLRNRKRHRERRSQMKTLRDCFGRQVRLTDERLAHILDHPERKEMDGEMERMLLQPQFVRRSRSDQAVRLFYEFYAQTIVGGKWLCVVVKYAENDAFVVTAYLTDKPKAGEDLWPTK